MAKTNTVTEVRPRLSFQGDTTNATAGKHRSSSPYTVPSSEAYDAGLARIPVTPNDDLKPTSRSYMGEPLEHLSRALSNSSRVKPAEDTLELRPTASHTAQLSGLPEEAGSPTQPIIQGVPPELDNLTKEIIFVLVCTSGQLLFSFFMGNVTVNQESFKRALGLQTAQTPWLVGSYLIALGLSVIVAGSLTDLVPPKRVVVTAFAWLTLWNIVGAFTLSPSRSVLFFFMRAMQGLAVGVLVSASMSILGRVYKPGHRKTQVFSVMATGAPLGFWIGTLQGGALSHRLPWVFGSTAMLCGLWCIAAWYTIPPLRPAADTAGSEAPGIRQFDFKGAICAVAGCICLLFGLTQGSAAHWSPYTYVLIIVGVLLLALFFWVEQRVARPMIPSKLWRTPGFAPLMLAYFLSFGGYAGAWQWYVVQFFLRIQRKSPLTVALYFIPNLIAGVIATFLVSRLLHKVPGHYIYTASMIAYALGPSLFLPQTRGTTYWALSMPGIAIATFGPDMAFASASIFITSNVARSYQGSAGSLLVTIQNLAAAIFTSLADAIATKVDLQPDGEIGLRGLKAAWWLALAAQLLGAVITAVAVRIPKEEEKEHAT